MNSKVQMSIVFAAILIPALFLYAIENPASTVAYVLFIEPSYVKKRTGHPLLDFRSYDTVKQVQADLRSRGYDFGSVTKNLSEGKSLPPYNLNTIEIKHYEHLSHSGNATLIFFNNRLCQVTFYPDDPLTYKTYLQKKTNRALREHGVNKVYPYIWLTIRKDQSEKKFYKWEDKRLMAEQQAWVMRHS